MVSERYVSNYYDYCFEKSALIWSLFFFFFIPPLRFNSFCSNIWQKFVCVYFKNICAFNQQTPWHLFLPFEGLLSSLTGALRSSHVARSAEQRQLCGKPPQSQFLFPFVSARCSLPVRILLEAS